MNSEFAKKNCVKNKKIPAFSTRVKNKAIQGSVLPGPVLPPLFTLVENARIFFFTKFFFANSEFIFAIRDPKLARV